VAHLPWRLLDLLGILRPGLGAGFSPGDFGQTPSEKLLALIQDFSYPEAIKRTASALTGLSVIMRL